MHLIFLWQQNIQSDQQNTIHYQKDFLTTKRYILGTIDNETFRSTLHQLHIKPNLSLQYYAQPFISEGGIPDFKYVTDATANRLPIDSNFMTTHKCNFKMTPTILMTI